VTAFDLLVLGDANPDLILIGDVDVRFGQAEQVVEDAVLTVGGSGAITACAAARLGLGVAFCGVVGDDLFGAFMRDQLADRGVDVRGLVRDPTAPTGVTVVLSKPDDRASLTSVGTIARLDATAIDRALLRSSRHVHVSQYFMQHALRPALPDLFDDAHAAGATTSIDPNRDPADRWGGGLVEVLDRTDVFLPNAAEALAIAREPDVVSAARSLARSGGTVAVKLGADGALAVRGGEVHHGDASPVVPRDATGAGDAFDAGFLAGQLAGEPLERALALANACGALSTRGLGGVEALPTMEEALALLAPETLR
jgi:sugar/nucleoside kinase (ribokinase family)